MFIKSIATTTLMVTLGLPEIVTAKTYDDFAAPVLWDVFSYGGGKPYTIPVNGQLEINIPSNSSGQSFGAGYTSLCRFRGDFDVQVDYSLLDFPASNGVRVGLVAGNVISKAKWGSGAEVMRISRGISENPSGIESYTTNIGYDCCHDIQTSDRIGKLRLARVRNSLSGYYYNDVDGQWVLITSNIVRLGDAVIEIGVWSHDSAFSDQPIKVVFDNVAINKGNLVGVSCPIK